MLKRIGASILSNCQTLIFISLFMSLLKNLLCYYYSNIQKDRLSLKDNSTSSVSIKQLLKGKHIIHRTKKSESYF